jgi:hypothetical protein
MQLYRNAVDRGPCVQRFSANPDWNGCKQRVQDKVVSADMDTCIYVRILSSDPGEHPDQAFKS